MSGYDLTDPEDREDRRKHLELLSAVIGRMAGASSVAKGWAITVAGAAIAVGVVRDSWYLYLLSIMGLVVFGIIDGLYLHNEKRFRDLYDAVVEDNSVAPLSMDPSVTSPRPMNKTYISWSVLGFYGPLILAGILIFVIALATDPEKRDDRDHHQRHGQHSHGHNSPGHEPRG